MTKRELYDTLKADGAKLKAFNTMNVEDLTALYTERFGKSPDESETGNEQSDPPEKTTAKKETKAKIPETKKNETDPAPARFPLLHFCNSGWCEALQRSYYQGDYRPATKEEYEALKPFAASER